MFSDFGHKKYPSIPAIIIKILPIQMVSIHTPMIPPIMPTINIKKRIKVLDEVGKIYDAMRLADEPAGEVKKNMKQMKTSSHRS